MKPSSLRRCLTGLGLLLLALPPGAVPAARAAGRSPPVHPSPALPPVLATLVTSGKLKVLSQFTTEVPGLTGYVVHNADGTQVVYGEHGYLFVGHLISPRGSDLTDNYRERYTPKPDYSAVVHQLDRGGHLIHEGPAAAPLLYVFADPNCSICYRFYRLAEPLVSSRRLQLRWAMVAFLQASSTAKATAILSARDPRAALHADEDRFDTTHESGGIAPAQSADKGLQGVLQAHMSAMDTVGGVGTPTLLYRDDRGHWAAIVGLPTGDWLNQYASGKPVPARPNG
jgi:thiol:disulfide interchange protein DsbG